MATAPVMPHNNLAFPPGGMEVNPTGANGTGGVTPTWGGPVPWGGNPVGQPVGGPTPFTPPTGSPGNYGYGTSGNPNPTASPNPTGPTTTMNPGGSGGTGIAGDPTVSPGVFAHTFGSGIAPVLAGEINTGGGYNSALTKQSVEAQAAEMQRQAMTGYGNLESGMGEAGINPNSSVAALEASNYWSNVTTAENSMTAQEYFNMWNESQNRETSLLATELGSFSKNRGGAMQWFDDFASGVGNLLGGSSYSSSSGNGSYTIG
jgi:hypothetical protein